MEKDSRFKHEKPYLSLLPHDGSFPVTNCAFATSKIRLTDLRQSPSPISFEENGFTIMQHPLTEKSLWDIAQGWKEPSVEPRVLRYLEEMRQCLKDYFAVDTVICFDWRVSSIYQMPALASLMYR